MGKRKQPTWKPGRRSGWRMFASFPVGNECVAWLEVDGNDLNPDKGPIGWSVTIRADHDFVAAGMMVALALAKAGHLQLVNALDVADGRYSRVYDFVARRMREDATRPDDSRMKERYTAMAKEVVRMIKVIARGAA